VKKKVAILILCFVNTALVADVLVKTLPLTGATAYGPISTVLNDFGLVLGGTTGSVNAAEKIIHHNAAIGAISDPFIGGWGYSQIGLDVFDGITSDYFTVSQAGEYKLVLKVKVNGSVMQGQLPGYYYLPGMGKTTGWTDIGSRLGGETSPDSVNRLHGAALGVWSAVGDVFWGSVKNALRYNGLGDVSKLITVLQTASSVRTWDNEIIELHSCKYLSANTQYRWAFYVNSRQASAQLLGSSGSAFYRFDATILSAELYYTGVLYTINSSAGSGGSISPRGNVFIADGGTATFYATPEPGYVVDHWHLDNTDGSSGAVSLTVSNIHANKNVQVVFKAENRMPALSNPRVSPASGIASTQFEFLVDYYDPDGDAPDAAYKKVYISGGREGVMTLKSGTPSNGTYHYTTTLPVGSYAYNFLFADNQGASAIIGRTGLYVFTNDSSIELKVEVNGGPVTNNIEIAFEYGPDLQHLQSTKWPASELPKSVGIDSGQEVMFIVSTESDNHNFIKWEFKNDNGSVFRESEASGYGFRLLSGNVHATAYFNYTPSNYTISGTVLRSDGAAIPNGVDLMLTSSEQTLLQHTNDGNFSFSGIKGGVPVTITPLAAGYSFAPSSRVYDNLRQNWSNQSMRGDSSDDLAATTSFSNVPPTVSDNSSVSFTWTGRDNVSTSQNLQYQYKLTGYDADWSAFASVTNKSYDVNNGAYVFQVRAKDEAGNISQVPANYTFVVNAAPKVTDAARIANSVWASRITLEMPTNSTHPTQTFVLLPEHSGIADAELVPVAIHLPDSGNASGGNENIAAKLGIPTMIVKAGTGWLVTLPRPLAQGQSVQYDIKWGKIKYFGWQDIVQIPQGFPNLTVGSDYSIHNEGSFLDDQFRMWRQAHKNKRRSSGGWGATKSWVFMDMADKNVSILPEQRLEYLPGILDNGSYACDYTGENGEIVKLGNNICYVWTSEKYEKVGGSNYTDHRYQRYKIALFDTMGNILNSYEDNWQEDTYINVPSTAMQSDLYITGRTYNQGANASELWFAKHNSQGQIVRGRTVFESIVRTNSGALDFWGSRACGENIVFLFNRSHDTLLHDDRQEICYQIRDAAGNVVKATTVINPPLLSDSIDEDDEYEFESVVTDNTGKVWISFNHQRPFGNYYMIIDSNGNVWKGNTFVGTDIWRRFYFCDKDGYIWATEGSNLLTLNSNDTQAFAPRSIAYIPNQNAGETAVQRDYTGASYRVYDRWSQQILQIDVPEGANLSYMEIYDLNLWANDLHTANPTIKSGETVVWSRSGQFTGSANVNVSAVLNDGQNLLTMAQNDFMGGQILVTFPYTITGDFNNDQIVDVYDLAVFVDQWLFEELSYDLYQDNQNIVNKNSFGVIANNWNSDNAQLAGFAAEWLQRDAGNADIAPAPDGDGVVNMLDFAVLAENWMIEQ